jgi:alpha-N-arabinofuranosidase
MCDLTSRPGWLGLRGRCVGLDDIDSPALVCRRQEHLWCRCGSLLDFDPAAEGDEAGLTLFRSHEYHYDLAVTMQSGRRKLLFRRTMGDLKVVVAAADLPPGPVMLEIEAQNKEYIFRYGRPARKNNEPGQTAELTELARARAHFLSNEVTGSPFTGVFVGMYAVSPNRPSPSTAWFDWFDYEPGKA